MYIRISIYIHKYIYTVHICTYTWVSVTSLGVSTTSPPLPHDRKNNEARSLEAGRMPSGEFGPEDTFIGARGGSHITIKQWRWQADTASTGSLDWMTNRLSFLHPSSFIADQASGIYPSGHRFGIVLGTLKMMWDFLGQKTRAVAFEWSTNVKQRNMTWCE